MPAQSSRLASSRSSTKRAASESSPATRRRLDNSSLAWVSHQETSATPTTASPRRTATARAAFKLIQMEDTLSLLKMRRASWTSCAAPGGWTQVVVERCAAAVVAVDLKHAAPVEGRPYWWGTDLAFGDRAHRVHLGRRGGRCALRRRARRPRPRRRRRAPPAVVIGRRPGVRAQGACTGRELRLQDIPGPRRGRVLRRARALCAQRGAAPHGRVRVCPCGGVGAPRVRRAPPPCRR